MSETLDYLIERAAFGNRAAETLRQLAELHQPADRDGPTKRYCVACVAGYDPATKELMFAAWPCRTAAVLEANR